MSQTNSTEFVALATRLGDYRTQHGAFDYPPDTITTILTCLGGIDNTIQLCLTNPIAPTTINQQQFRQLRATLNIDTASTAILDEIYSNTFASHKKPPIQSINNQINGYSYTGDEKDPNSDIDDNNATEIAVSPVMPKLALDNSTIDSTSYQLNIAQSIDTNPHSYSAQMTAKYALQKSQCITV